MTPDTPDTPGDPLTWMAEGAAAVAEQYKAYVEAGIPPSAAAVIIGTIIGTMGQSGGES